MGDFGKFLKEKRQEKGLTQKELAKALFVSESAISKWEKGVAHPDISLLSKLSEILCVTEHELITASIDNKFREEKAQAKKWRTFSTSWNLFWLISYIIAIIPCFICNLAINGVLTWFWIVVSALLLSFTFTNLPKFIKKYKLIFVPLSMFLALCLLLGVCCIYTKGDWFLIPVLSVLLGLLMIFIPIYIAKLKIFEKVRKYNDFISVNICFILLNILLIVLNFYTNDTSYIKNWYITIALPIVVCVNLVLNLLLCIRFIPVNRFLKTSIILTLINLVMYLPPMFVKVESAVVQKEIDSVNILKANFSCWVPDISLENNVHCIIALTMLGLALIFSLFGLYRYYKRKNNG